ncbi:MAG TPA: hypothetical protein VFE60_16420, partial [Roseiarcus sp.]|nr:hypothetical protein [Roseiarcus sp.]
MDRYESIARPNTESQINPPRSYVKGEPSLRRLIEGALALALAIAPICAADAQDAMRGLDLTSPDMTMAEMTRAEVEAALKAAPGRRG